MDRLIVFLDLVGGGVLPCIWLIPINETLNLLLERNKCQFSEETDVSLQLLAIVCMLTVIVDWDNYDGARFSPILKLKNK